MKRHAAKVTGNGKTRHFETIEAAYVWAGTNGGGTIWKARERTKSGGWTKVATFTPC